MSLKRELNSISGEANDDRILRPASEAEHFMSRTQYIQLNTWKVRLLIRIALFNLVDLNDLGQSWVGVHLGSAHEKFGVYIRSKYILFTWTVVYGVLAAEDDES